MCIAHQAISELPRILCVECARTSGERDEGDSWEDDNTTSVRYRRDYQNHGYSPLLWYGGHTGAGHGEVPSDPFPSGAASGFDAPVDEDQFDDDAGFDDDDEGDVTAFDS